MNTLPTIQDKLTGVSRGPGVYLMKDAAAKVIYIGKAKNIRKRLASYFKNSGQLNVRAGILATKISDFETIITRTGKRSTDPGVQSH